MFRAVKLRAIVCVSMVLLMLVSSNEAQNIRDYSKLQQDISACFSGITGNNSEIGYVFYDYDGNEIASSNKNKALTPASNQKLATSAAAYKYLTSAYKFETNILRKGNVNNKQLVGDLIVCGSGDPTIGTNYNDNENSVSIFKDWAKKIKEEGIESITGDIIFNKNAFDDQYRHKNWPKDQILKYYEAPISALSFNDNCIELNVSPSSKLSQSAIVEVLPKNSGIAIKNKVYTRKAGGNPLISFSFTDDYTLEVSGTIPLRSQTYSTEVAIMQPVKFFAEVFTGALRDAGITINGFIKIPDKDSSLVGAEPIIVHQTSVMDIIKVMNQKSQNFYAEQIFKSVGAFKTKKTGTFESGELAVSDYLKSLGVAKEEYKIDDGSGLSKENKISVNALCKILDKFSKEMKETLAISGDSNGTLKRRFTGNMKGKVFAKTGTINNVDAISGYIIDKNNKWHRFSIIVNTTAHGHAVVRQKMDAAVKVVFDYFDK